MSGLFLSYSRNDQELAEKIVRAMRAIGVTVWWDEDMSAVYWQKELYNKIHELSCVLVIWTEHSVESENVKDEARLARREDKLLNVMVGVSSPPFPFEGINGFNLDDWTGREPHRGWTRVVNAVEELLVQNGGGKPGEILDAQTLREEQIREHRKAITDAQADLRRLQAREIEIGEAKKQADLTVERAQDQLQRVAEMRAVPAILRAAQQEFDTAFEAREDAATALQKNRREFERASTTLASAMEAFEALFTAPEPIARIARPPPSPRPARPRDEVVPLVASDPEPAAPPASKPRGTTSRRAPRPKPVALPPEEPLLISPRAVEAPAIAPATAAFAPAAPPLPPARSAGNRSFVIAGIAVVLVLVVGAIFLVVHPPAGGGTTASAAPAPAPSVAAPPAAAEALVGHWALPGLGCDDPVTVSVNGDQLTVTSLGVPTTATIESGDAAGPVKTHGAAGDASYTVRQGRMTMVDSSGRTTYTRCAG